MKIVTVISLVVALPLSIGAEIMRYVYQDWEFAKWIGMAVAVDTLLGILKHLVHKDASSESFFAKFSKKIAVYILLLILANILTNFTVNGSTIGATDWMGTYLCVYMLVREAISVMKNANAVIPIFPKSFIKRFKDFNENGEYIKRGGEE
jgi:phage-related holin